MLYRWLGFFIALCIGMGVGLYYGWVVNPVRYVNTTPSSLQEDYKTDYVWMVAEAFSVEHNPELAARRLDFLGGNSVWETARDAYLAAIAARFRDVDIERIRNLEEAMRQWVASTPTPVSTP